MNSLDDRIRKYIESMNLRNNPRITMKKRQDIQDI